MKNKKDFGEKYDNLKLSISKVFNRIKNIRKHTYNHILNKILPGNEVVFVEDLTFNAIEKSSKKYKGKKFNDFINIMGRGIWKSLLEYKAKVVGNHLIYISPEYTSQECFKCGFIHKNNRNGRHFKCKVCGYFNDSDINGAMIIFRRGISIVS